MLKNIIVATLLSVVNFAYAETYELMDNQAIPKIIIDFNDDIIKLNISSCNNFKFIYQQKDKKLILDNGVIRTYKQCKNDDEIYDIARNIQSIEDLNRNIIRVNKKKYTLKIMNRQI